MKGLEIDWMVNRCAWSPTADTSPAVVATAMPKYSSHIHSSVCCTGGTTLEMATPAICVAWMPRVRYRTLIIRRPWGADCVIETINKVKQAGMRATMFVISGAASEPGIYYASWDKVEGYAKSGRWDIQSHTAESHRDQKTGLSVGRSHGCRE